MLTIETTTRLKVVCDKCGSSSKSPEMTDKLNDEEFVKYALDFMNKLADSGHWRFISHENSNNYDCYCSNCR